MDDKTVTERFFGLAGAPVSSYCGDKSVFLGPYHDYGDPAGVAAGDLGNTDSYNENSCGALSCVVELAPGEQKTVAFVLGMKPSAEAAEILQNYADPAAAAAREIEALKAEWYGRFSHLQVQTPDPAFNTMLNTWNAYNCFITFVWSRAASLIYCGLRNGYGYRDTVQDIQGIIHLEPEMACEKIRFMLFRPGGQRRRAPPGQVHPQPRPRGYPGRRLLCQGDRPPRLPRRRRPVAVPHGVQICGRDRQHRFPG